VEKTVAFNLLDGDARLNGTLSDDHEMCIDIDKHWKQSAVKLKYFKGCLNIFVWLSVRQFGYFGCPSTFWALVLIFGFVANVCCSATVLVSYKRVVLFRGWASLVCFDGF